MNSYFKNLNKIEFVVTYACTGRCKHCSEGEHSTSGEHIDPEIAAKAVKELAFEYPLQTVMTFGGEPLLFPEVVYSVMKAATECGVPKRQLITNGYFSAIIDRIRTVAQGIAEAGVNDLLLSVDAFHQETIPLETVKLFAKALKDCGVPVRLHPAWLVSPEDDNPYNRKTREILHSFASMELYENEGNVVFPSGNALKYLAEYFADTQPENPYIEDPYNIKCISVDPDGALLGGNLYRQSIMEIIKDYDPLK